MLNTFLHEMPPCTSALTLRSVVRETPVPVDRHSSATLERQSRLRGIRSLQQAGLLCLSASAVCVRHVGFASVAHGCRDVLRRAMEGFCPFYEEWLSTNAGDDLGSAAQELKRRDLICIPVSLITQHATVQGRDGRSALSASRTVRGLAMCPSVEYGTFRPFVLQP